MRRTFLAQGIFTAFVLSATVFAAPVEANGNKVTICHIPPGTPDNAQTITLSEKAVPAHLAHGDTLGACPSGCLLAASQCNDQNFCTDDVCLPSGECAHQPVSCDDSNVCTQDLCVPTEGCVYIPADHVQCDDNNSCTNNDYCQDGACAGTSVPGCCLNDWDCGDADLCSADSCGSGHACVNKNIDCSISDMCFTGLCDPSTGGCVSYPVECNDGNVCTDDSCDAETGCLSVPTSYPPEPVEVTCNDGIDNDCDGKVDSHDGDCVVSETTDLSTDLSDTPDPVLANSVLTYTISWTNNGPETASQANAFLVLDPSATLVSFTLHDNCFYSPETHRIECTFLNVAPQQILLLQVDVLPLRSLSDPTGDPPYDMQVAAKIESAIEIDSHEQNDSDAETTTVFTCVSDNPCVVGVLQPSPSGGMECGFNPSDGVSCSAPCFDDGVCSDGTCELGSPVECPASDDACMTGYCSPATGACEALPVANGSACDDGNLCTNDEQCLSGECAGGAELVCDDGDLCTTDFCDPEKGSCSFESIPECSS